MRRTVKVIVTVQSTSKKLLTYIDKYINDINRKGIIVDIEKISDKDLVESKINELARRKITRLPALIDINGEVLIGLEKIISRFENVPKAAYDERFSPLGTADTTDISTLWHNELFEFDDADGKYKPRKDPEAEEDHFSDISKRMRDYEERAPKHRRPDSGRRDRGAGGARNDFDAPRQRDRGRDRDMRDHRDAADDNIDTGYDEPHSVVDEPRIPISHSDDSHGDALDDIMMRAWMNNNSGGSNGD